MVKGVTKQVIVVRSPDSGLFDEAIFLLNAEALGDGISREALLKEAERAFRGGSGRYCAAGGAFPGILGAFVGAASASLLFLAVSLL